MIKKILTLLFLFCLSDYALATVDFMEPMDLEKISKTLNISLDSAKSVQKAMSESLKLAGVVDLNKAFCDYSKVKQGPMVFCGARYHNEKVGKNNELVETSAGVAVSAEKVDGSIVLVTENYTEGHSDFPKQVILLK
ncbi:MAG: hypothetical protein JSS53_07355 [Proteobacteria bacterium]|nr:hypothetical protein [Pseudomonadota bacterium]